MAAGCLTPITEQWIRDRLNLKHPCLGVVRSLSLPGTYEEKIRHLGKALNNFVGLKSLDLSYNSLSSVKGVHHLKHLERLILCSNRIPSLKELTELSELPALRELDLRLNPLTRSDSHYRLHLVHMLPSLRKLDACPVRDSERKAAIMHFSSDLRSPQRSSNVNELDADERYFCQMDANSHKSQREVQPFTDSFHRKTHDSESEVPHVKKTSYQRSSASFQVTDKPKVSFGPCEEKPRLESPKQKLKSLPKQTRYSAKGHYTPRPDLSGCHGSAAINIRPPSPRQPGLDLSDPCNPILHPPGLTYSSFNKTEGGSSPLRQRENQKRGSYRKPLEMLLNLVDKHWKGEQSLHHNNNFLSQAVHILSMMEGDISGREAEVRTLRWEADALSFHAAAREEEHKTEVCDLAAQLETAHSTVGRLNEQLRIVLQENVSLQKQLIRSEQQYLESVKDALTEVEQLRKEIDGLN